MQTWPQKDPAERLDYKVDWSGALGDDTLQGEPEVSATGGLVIESTETVGKITTLWISGGDPASSALETSHVCLLGSTVGGRMLSIKINLPVGGGC